MEALDAPAQVGGAVRRGVEDIHAWLHLKSEPRDKTSAIEYIPTLTPVNSSLRLVPDVLVGPPPTPPLASSTQSHLATLTASQSPRGVERGLRLAPIVPPPLLAAPTNLPASTALAYGAQRGGSTWLPPPPGPIVPPTPPTPPPFTRLAANRPTRSSDPGLALAPIVSPPPLTTAQAAPAALLGPAAASRGPGSMQGIAKWTAPLGLDAAAGGRFGQHATRIAPTSTSAVVRSHQFSYTREQMAAVGAMRSGRVACRC
jgi:hypothetical protein